MHEDRGAVIESLVACTLRQVSIAICITCGTYTQTGIHSNMHEDRGAVIESLVARTLRQVSIAICMRIEELSYGTYTQTGIHSNMHEDRGAVIWHVHSDRYP